MRKPFKSTFGTIKLKDNSTIYIVSDENSYKKVEGKSTEGIRFDEKK